ncbi:hypothetical protein C8A01DRAFT_16949 [Parachaetomium inaequale]|uniref:Pentatricopeptide repeat-containing protein-mitochondrial domain-containing protein n=1 Tax=Parachaetomium inaequale TaxID=2588326 RepID=A0AAN6SR35_9PEZI|nr:hypothetical protein C8A01DRAFT_16949 [Parachaetomium inaequale]
MSAKRATVDALSRALCPSIYGPLLPKAASFPLRSGTRGRVNPHQHETGPPSTCRAGQVRALHTSRPVAGPLARRERYPTWAAAPAPRAPKQVTEKKPPPAPATPAFPSWATKEPTVPRLVRYIGRALPDPEELPKPDQATSSDQGPHPVSATTLCESKSTLPPETASAATPVIYDALRKLRDGTDQAPKIRRLVRYLVEERGERPNVFMYEALLTANWDTATGSAGDMWEIYKEMRDRGLYPSPGWYHSALKLLAIHPDYLSRNTLLERMEQQGIELNDEGKCSVALGLLRDGQLEMALDYWDKMRDTGTQVPEWVSSIFIYVLVMRGFVDEAVQLVQQTLAMAGASSKALPLVVWSYLLDECSRSLHYEGTKLAWDKMVSPGAINPADGIALNVLSTAARHGDAALATAVIELLSNRDAKLGYQHYEPLLDAYVRDGRLAAAFRVLCIMSDAGVHPDRASTRSIFAALKEAPELADEAVKTLGDLQRVPVAAINVLLEGVAAATGGDMARTLDVYRQVRDLCQSGPNEHTFVLLLEGCDAAEPAVFLVSEMDRYSVRPTPAILDHLIRCFARDGNLDVALLYVDEMGRLAQSGAWMSERTLRAVVRRCYRDKNPKFFSLVAEAKRRGMRLDMEALGVGNGAGWKPEEVSL